MKWKWVLWVAAAAIVLWFALRPDPAVPVEVVSVRVTDVRAELAERARTELPAKQVISMPITGRLLPIEVREGDRVEAGQVVARLDEIELAADVAAAEKRVRIAESGIRLNQDRALLAIAHAEYERIDEALAAVIASSVERERASDARLEFAGWWLESQEQATQTGASSQQAVREARVQKATSEVDATTAELVTSAMRAIDAALGFMPPSIDAIASLLDEREVGLEHQLALSRIELERAQRELQRVEVRAESAGVVLARYVEGERELPGGTVLLELGDLTDLEVVAEVLTVDALRMRVGQTAEIAGLGDGPLPARVRLIEPNAFTKLSSLGVEEQRVRVSLTPDAAALGALSDVGVPLGVGFSVRVVVHLDRRDGVLAVPRRALVRDGDGGWSVFVLEEGRARRRAVEPGLFGPREVEVTAGLRRDERVVLSPPSGLADGDRIAP